MVVCQLLNWKDLDFGNNDKHGPF